jgi:DNA-3-methyladenine glycosylase I
MIREHKQPVEPVRCAWAQEEPSRSYHDAQWGVPVHEDRLLFEFLILEGAQAGLSWTTILNKREGYRQALDNFDPALIARYTPAKQAELLANRGIVRNRLKIASTIQNAKAVLAIQAEFGSLDTFLWKFVNGEPIQSARTSMADVPARTTESDAMSKALKKRGLNFVGTTICYAFMQAVGMVNDHLVDCYRHTEVQRRGAMARPDQKRG